MNLTSDDVAAGVLRDRAHAGSSMADIEPMAIDRTVSCQLPAYFYQNKRYCGLA